MHLKNSNIEQKTNTKQTNKQTETQNKKEPGIKSTFYMNPYIMKFKNKKKLLMMLEIRIAVVSGGSDGGINWKGKCVGC